MSLSDQLEYFTRLCEFIAEKDREYSDLKTQNPDAEIPELSDNLEDIFINNKDNFIKIMEY